MLTHPMLILACFCAHHAALLPILLAVLIFFAAAAIFEILFQILLFHKMIIGT